MNKHPESTKPLHILSIIWRVLLAFLLMSLISLGVFLRGFGAHSMAAATDSNGQLLWAHVWRCGVWSC